ncbi:hypothetical protein P8452_50312 [Trifolium repens]|nr:hypothetical protein P8452_50312 [Trifolium repens]
MTKKIVPNNVFDVVLKHCISLDLKLYGEDIVYCKYCDSVVTGGFYRFTCHLTGMENVEACEGVGDDVRKEMLEILTTLQEINDNGRKGKGDEVVVGSQDSLDGKETLSEEARRAVARFFYNNVIPFEAVSSDEFLTMCDLVSRHGVGFKPPNFIDIKWKYFKEELKLTMEVLEEHRAMWKITGCTIMVDGCTDMDSRTILNLLVNSPLGTIFLKSIDASEILGWPDKLFKMMDDIVEEVGEENVVQIVTENAPYYKVAGEMLMKKRTRLYWTPCATHSIEWILQNCEDIPIHQETIAAYHRITLYIYGDASLTTLLRRFTKGIEICRFSIGYSKYMTLCALHENRGAFIRMFTSEEWKSSKFAETRYGKTIEELVLDKEFWKNVMICYKGIYPLLEVLRLANSTEEPTMGFIYEAMEKAKEEIRRGLSKDGIERESSMLIQKNIDEIWDMQLDSPLYAAGYFLNPQFHYSPGFRDNIKVKHGLDHCITRMVADPEERSKIEIQLDNFDKQANHFAHPIAVITADDEIPPIWWASSVDGQPELQNFAIRVLCLTCSSYGGRRNEKAFEMVHAKSLKEKIDNDVAFVMANSKLAEKKRASDELNLNGKRDFEGSDVAFLMANSKLAEKKRASDELNLNGKRDFEGSDVAFLMANSKLAEKKRASDELYLNDKGDIEDSDVADLHDGDEDEDEDGDEDEDEDGDEDGDEN